MKAFPQKIDHPRSMYPLNPGDVAEYGSEMPARLCCATSFPRSRFVEGCDTRGFDADPAMRPGRAVEPEPGAKGNNRAPTKSKPSKSSIIHIVKDGRKPCVVAITALAGLQFVTPTELFAPCAKHCAAIYEVFDVRTSLRTTVKPD